MSNVYTRYELSLQSNIIASLRQHEDAATKFESSLNRIQGVLGSIATLWAAHKIFDIGKEWIQGAADYETAMQRIKNVSFNSVEGFKNQFFIREEVDKFKIDLQKATDAYGDFLTMVRGSGLASAEIRKLHDEVLTIGKVTHISEGQMDAAVRNMGKLLEEGTLESKHLRPLSYQLSGFMPYLSKELGKTNQELEKSISSGNLTKSAIDSRVLLDAIQKYAEDLAPKLGESLNTVQSHMTDLSNTWLEFKNDIVLGQKPEVIELFAALKEGIIWLGAHTSQIIHLGEAIVKLIEFYAAYRIGLLAINGVTVLVNSSLGIQAVESASVARAVTSETAAMQRLVAVMEEYVSMQNTATESALAFTDAQLAQIGGLQAQIMAYESSALVTGTGLRSGAAAATAGGAALGSRIVGAVSTAAIVVGVAWVASEVLESFGAFGKWKSGDNKSFSDIMGWGDRSKNTVEGVYSNESKQGLEYMRTHADEYIDFYQKKIQPGADDEDLKHDRAYLEMLQYLKEYPANTGIQFDESGNPIPWDKFRKMMSGGDWAPDAFNKEDAHPHLGNTQLKDKLKSSQIRGNSVTTINIDIKEMNGLNQCTFEVRNQRDYDNIKDTIGTEVTRVLIGAINDAQVIKK